MLHLVGLGLADEKDITVRGLEIVKKAERVYLEAYTAILLVDKSKLVSDDLWKFKFQAWPRQLMSICPVPLTSCFAYI